MPLSPRNFPERRDPGIRNEQERWMFVCVHRCPIFHQCEAYPSSTASARSSRCQALVAPGGELPPAFARPAASWKRDRESVARCSQRPDDGTRDDELVEVAARAEDALFAKLS